MKLYLISQNKNNGYDTYDSVVVCAKDEEEAKRISPDDYYVIGEDDKWYFKYADGSIKQEMFDSWTEIEAVKVQYLGGADKNLEKGVILASYNAG